MPKIKLNLGKLLKQVIPTVASALTGPIAGVAVKFVAKKLNLPPETTQEQLGQHIAQATPEELHAAKKADQEFKLEMEKLDIDLEALAVEDRKSARELFSINIWPQMVMSAVLITGFLILLNTLMKLEPGTTLNSAAILALGSLFTFVAQIITFWFGSSKRSKDKTAALIKSSEV